jgi:hypothetical protein
MYVFLVEELFQAAHQAFTRRKTDGPAIAISAMAQNTAPA